MKKTLNRKQLVESIKECQKLLKEKKLKESSFEELIAPGMELLNSVHKKKEEGSLDLPPLDDDSVDISKVLNTSEKDLSVDGTLSEAYYKKNKNRLLQERDRTYSEIVAAYKSQGGSDNYDEWKAWTGSQVDKTKAQIINRYNFQKLYQTVTVDSNSSEAVENKEPYVPSKNLQDLIDVCDAADDFVESATTTVTDKYETIELLLRRVIRGKSTKRYYLLAGDPGIGKTYEVTKLLKEEGKTDVPTCTGSIGRSPTSIATFLWKYKDAELVILDDCDSFLRKGGNLDVVNILKGCMEAGTGYKVGIPQAIANRASKMLSVKAESKVSDKVKRLFEDDEELDDEEVTFDTSDEEALTDVEGSFTESIPTSWSFNARLIILSNLHESQIEEALWSRCDHFDLHLTQEEYLVRLAMIIDNMDVGQKDGLFTEEDAKEAKALVLSVMNSIIEAGNHGVKLFGKFIRLTNHLEFRIVKDLCNMWLAMLDREMETNPNESKDEAKKKIIQKWVRIGVIPRLSVSTKL